MPAFSIRFVDENYVIDDIAVTYHTQRSILGTHAILIIRETYLLLILPEMQVEIFKWRQQVNHRAVNRNHIPNCNMLFPSFSPI